MKLYKYKTCDKRNIATLYNNQLWVSNLYNMNDPQDSSIYVYKSDCLYEVSLIDEFINNFQKSVYCMSFSLKNNSNRLWNYYSNGMRGMILVYNINDIETALKEQKLINYEKGSVTYSDKKLNCEDEFNKYLSNEEINISLNKCFIKNKSWEDEEEYRFILPNINKDDGLLLCNIKPIEIIVGYKISKKDYNNLYKYADINNITLKICYPNFKSNRFNSYILTNESLNEIKKEII